MIEDIFELFTKTHKIWIKVRSRIVYKFLLKKLGRFSYIRKGFKISGNPKRIIIGTRFQVYEKCFFTVSKNGFIEIGNNGLIGVGSYLNASEGRILIGNNVAIGPYCKFFSYSHHFCTGELYTNQSLSADVIIEDNVFIGTNVVILPGVIIHKNSVVAAGAVVKHNVEGNTLVGGIPAKLIKRI